VIDATPWRLVYERIGEESNSAENTQVNEELEKVRVWIDAPTELSDLTPGIISAEKNTSPQLAGTFDSHALSTHEGETSSSCTERGGSVDFVDVGPDCYDSRRDSEREVRSQHSRSRDHL